MREKRSDFSQLYIFCDFDPVMLLAVYGVPLRSLIVRVQSAIGNHMSHFDYAEGVAMQEIRCASGGGSCLIYK